MSFTKILKHDEASYASFFYNGKSYGESRDPWLQMNLLYKVNYVIIKNKTFFDSLKKGVKTKSIFFLRATIKGTNTYSCSIACCIQN